MVRAARRSSLGRRAIGGLVAAIALGAMIVATEARAQEESPSDAEAPARLAADAPLTLRPTSRTRALCRAIARTLALRIDVPVAVGDDAPPEILEAVPAGHVAIGREDDRVLLVLAGPEAQVYRSEVAIDGAGADAVRSVALAVEALRDAALDGPPPGRARRRTYTIGGGQSVEWTYLEPEGGLFGPRPNLDARATPMVSLGFMTGLSTERLTAIVGPRIMLGLCLGDTCVSLEGDLPVLPDESRSCDGRVIQYRPVNLGMRLTLRPIHVDDVSFAFHFGLLTRFGIANLVGVDVRRLVSDFGIRSGLEIAWRMAAPFEVYFEIGADVHTSPATFSRTPRPPPGADCPTSLESILVEDLVSTWAVLGVRLRP